MGKDKMNIALTGFMGCGKTCVGKALARLLPEYSLIDLDEYIESMAGRSIPDIFREDGEPAFRALEAKALGNIFKEPSAEGGKPLIISLGGGTVTTEPCRKLIHEYSVCFYLKASIETLVANLLNMSEGRPMLNPDGGPMSEEKLRRRIQQLMATRATIYESAADRIIAIDGKQFGQIAEEIKNLI
jgi:shikimate kinase